MSSPRAVHSASTEMTATSSLLIDSQSGESVHFYSNTTRSNKYSVLSVISVLLLVGIAVFVYFVAFKQPDEPSFIFVTNTEWEQRLLSIPSNASARNISYSFAFQPHVAGEEENFQLADIMTAKFQEWGYDIISDDINDAVLDRYLNSSLSVTLSNETRLRMDLSNEYIVGDKDSNTSFRKRAWNSYSASADITYPLLYVNKGNSDDYLDLINVGFNLSAGYIGLVRSGSRGTLVHTAALYGLKGLIMFMDRDNNGIPLNETYGNEQGIRLPPSGFQYGTIKYDVPCVGNIEPQRLQTQCGFNASGDNYDRLFPSIYYNVPMITISSENAQKLFAYFAVQNDAFGVDGACELFNVSGSNEWSAWIPNVANIDKYCLGGNLNVNLMTSNEFSPESRIENRFAYKKGVLYPDEIVMIGAHRDSWALGACDDISGITTMMEVARTLSVMIQNGFVLKRSVMFAAWDGEEWGLFGSTQFNEERRDIIDKLVSYHNLDMTVQGDNFVVMVTPLIESLMIDAMKEVHYPYPDKQRDSDNDNRTRVTIYDYWMNEDETKRGPLIGQLNSDYGSFVYYSGVPSMESGFWGYTPTYHTFYDVNGWLDLVDPTWKYAEHLAQYVALVTLRLTQNHIIPYNLYDLYNRVDQWRSSDLVNLANSLQCDIVSNPLHLALLNKSIDDLRDAMHVFYADLNVFLSEYNDTLSTTKSDASYSDFDANMLESVQQYNTVLMEFNKCFRLEYPDGLPLDHWFKNMLWKPGPTGSRFPYIGDTIRMQQCSDESLSEAFNITATMFYRASQLLLRAGL